MNNLLIRFVAILLVPCLIAEPCIAAMARPDVPRAAIASSLSHTPFGEQAFVSRLIISPWKSLSTRLRSQYARAAKSTTVTNPPLLDRALQFVFFSAILPQFIKLFASPKTEPSLLRRLFKKVSSPKVFVVAFLAGCLVVPIWTAYFPGSLQKIVLLALVAASVNRNAATENQKIQKRRHLPDLSPTERTQLTNDLKAGKDSEEMLARKYNLTQGSVNDFKRNNKIQRVNKRPGTPSLIQPHLVLKLHAKGYSDWMIGKILGRLLRSSRKAYCADIIAKTLMAAGIRRTVGAPKKRDSEPKHTLAQRRTTSDILKKPGLVLLLALLPALAAAQTPATPGGSLPSPGDFDKFVHTFWDPKSSEQDITSSALQMAELASEGIHEEIIKQILRDGISVGTAYASTAAMEALNLLKLYEVLEPPSWWEQAFNVLATLNDNEAEKALKILKDRFNLSGRYDSEIRPIIEELIKRVEEFRSQNRPAILGALGLPASRMPHNALHSAA